jgi:hypothetical protein
MYYLFSFLKKNYYYIYIYIYIYTIIIKYIKWQKEKEGEDEALREEVASAPLVLHQPVKLAVKCLDLILNH